MGTDRELGKERRGEGRRRGGREIPQISGHFEQLTARKKAAFTCSKNKPRPFNLGIHDLPFNVA